MPDIWLKVENQEVRQALGRLLAKVEDPAAELIEIGELMVDRTKQRFSTSTAPDGTPWPANSEVTLQRYLGQFSGAISKRTGKATKAGTARLASKKPLIGESHALSTTIRYRLVAGGVEWGSGMPYAAMQQFGGTRRQFPHLWGDIPARPFLGLAAEDTDDVLRILYRGIGHAWDGG